MLEAMKLNLASLVSLNAESTKLGNMIAASIILTFITFTPLVFTIVLFKNRDRLKELKSQESYGVLFFGKNVHRDDHQVHWLPLAFFFRRTLFVYATVLLLDQPNLQMISNYLLSLLTVIYMTYDSRFYSFKSLLVLEVGTETSFIF